MSRTTMGAAFAAIVAASMPMALAQTPSATAPPPAAGTTTDMAVPAKPETANRVMAGQVRFSDMNGATVYDAQNKNVGDINNVILDRDGRVAAVAIKTGAFLGIGGKTVAVAMRDVKVSTDNNGKPRFSVELTKDQLKSAQAYDTSAPNNTASGGSAPPANGTRK